MAIEQQIEELRAELSGCDEPTERARIAAELDAARAQLAALAGAIDLPVWTSGRRRKASFGSHFPAR